MKKIIVFQLLTLTFFFNNHIVAEKLITFFLKPYPVITNFETSKKFGDKLHRSGKIASNRSKHYLPPRVSGVFATYAGYLTVSDLNGEISFPRKDNRQLAQLNVVCTEQLSPIIMTGNTVHHWEIEDGVPATMYSFEQKIHPLSKIHYWDVNQVPLPENNRIPIESIVILANPKYVYVPLGASLFKQSPHLILPDIYIKKGINLTGDALYVVNLAHYFGALIPLYKKENIRYSRHLTY